MNTEELKKALDKEGVKPIYYSLNGCTTIMSVVTNLTFNISIQKIKLVNTYSKN